MEKENKTIVAMPIISLGTIIIYHILTLEVGIFWYRKGILGNYIIPGSAVAFMALPGIVSAILFYLYSRNSKKSIIVAALTSIGWVLWFLIYVALTYEVH